MMETFKHSNQDCREHEIGSLQSTGHERQPAENLKKAQEKEALKRREFEASLEKLWGISTPDADFLIRADRLHDQDSRSEDRIFLKDQKGARQMELGEPDMRYGEASENKEGRQVNKNKQDGEQQTRTG